MNIFKENKNFYPTPKNIISKMWNKIPYEDREKIKYICEGQAGAGHIVEHIKSYSGGHSRKYKIHCLEKDQNLVSVLRGKGFNVIGYDFLNFTGSNKYDLIIGNPPFNDGEKHLLKAIDIMFSGHIVYLLNAETIKNPCTNLRKVLVQRLKDLNADIEYLPGAFMEAERKTRVEAALIYIKIEREIGLKETRDSITAKMQNSLNEVIENIRVSYWGEVLTLDKVAARMTERKRKEFYESLKTNTIIDFTEENIRIFILNLINNYEEILTDAVMDLFGKMTIENSYHDKLHTKNIHYFNGWKTNNAYFVNKKVILPIRGGGYDSTAFFGDYSGWQVHYSVKEELNDIDKVANYFDGKSKYVSIVQALNKAFDQGESKKILSTYFEITVFKKGTIHLIFRDTDILRRFNVTACKGKSWLPHDYGNKNYENLNPVEKSVVDSFENKKTYNKNVVAPGNSLFKTKELLQIGFAQDETKEETAA